MNKLIQRFKEFKNDESGMEFLQVAFVVLLVLALVAVIITLGTSVQGKIQEAADAVGGTSINLTP